MPRISRRPIPKRKQALDQDSAETLVTGTENLSSEKWGFYTEPRLSADGSWALYAFTANYIGLTTPYNLMRVPPSGGLPQVVMTVRGLIDLRCARSPANLCVAGTVSPDLKHLTFISFDPVQGRGRDLMKIQTDPGPYYQFDLSPDGSRLAVQKAGDNENRIRILPLDGSAAHDVEAKGWRALDSVDWAADGKGFFCSSPSPQGATLLHVDLDGNARALWTQKGSFHTSGIPSPDGKRIAIRSATMESNVWMIENF